jgi:hypothetical protein
MAVVNAANLPGNRTIAGTARVDIVMQNSRKGDDAQLMVL